MIETGVPKVGPGTTGTGSGLIPGVSEQSGSVGPVAK